jgi:hypothetical protein
VARNTHTAAFEPYNSARFRVDRKILRLQSLLRDHTKMHAANPTNWTFAGDLGHVTELLDQAIELLGGAKETT